MQNTRPVAASLARIVANLAKSVRIGYSGSFLAGSAPVNVWMANDESFVLSLMDGNIADDGTEGYVRTVALVPGDLRAIAVIETRDGEVITLGDFTGLRAALIFALEYVCAPNWHAGAQDAHDSVAV